MESNAWGLMHREELVDSTRCKGKGNDFRQL